jgi:hypothetical protein
MSINITIAEADFERVLGEVDSRRLRNPQERRVETLGANDHVDDVLNSLPKVIAERFRRMLPEGFEIHEIELSVGLSGAPFGVGISGEALLRFGPKQK